MEKTCMVIILMGIIIVPGLTTGQPIPESYDWGVNESDSYTWTIDKLRMNFEPIEKRPIFEIIFNKSVSPLSPYSADFLMNVTEGDAITIQIQRLGDPEMTEMDLVLSTAEEEFTFLWNNSVIALGFIDYSGLVPFLTIPAIAFIAERNYYNTLIDFLSQDQSKYGVSTLKGDLLNTTYEFYDAINATVTTIIDISTGLLHHYRYYLYSGGISMTVIEFEFNLVTPTLLPSITTGYEYFIGITGLISLLTIIKRKRKLS